MLKKINDYIAHHIEIIGFIIVLPFVLYYCYDLGFNWSQNRIQEKNISNISDEYQAYAEKCKTKNSDFFRCCHNSVVLMQELSIKPYNKEEECDGMRPKSLGCAGSYHWCPVEEGQAESLIDAALEREEKN